MNKTYIIIILIIFFVITQGFVFAQTNLSSRLSGNILLQTEENGEAWYVNPSDQKKYFLSYPDYALTIMRSLGLGITNSDLEKIPVGFMNYIDEDNDNDGLANRFEEALGTDINNKDTDQDGHSDKHEIENGFSANNSDTLPINMEFTNKNKGKIFLQIEKNGEAWYVNPQDLKRYYLGRPIDAFEIMKKLSIGITNNDLQLIPTGYIYNLNSIPELPIETNKTETPSEKNTNYSNDSAQNTIDKLANAIREGNLEKINNYFPETMHKRMEYALKYLDAEGRLLFGNILSGSTLTSSSENNATFIHDVYFSLGGYNVEVEIGLEKQENERWLVTKL